MTHFQHTPEAAAFIATADSRETSRQIMEAIAAFAANADEAKVIWEVGIENWDERSARAFVDTATRDGQVDAADLVWGAAGSNWLPKDFEA
jgi:hypothetical protein